MKKLYTRDFVKPKSICEGALITTRRALADCEVRGWVADDLGVPYSRFCEFLSTKNIENEEIIKAWSKKWEFAPSIIKRIVLLDPHIPSILKTTRMTEVKASDVLANLKFCVSIVQRNLNQPIDEQKRAIRKWTGLDSEYAILAPSLYHCSEILIDASIDEGACECHIDERILFMVATWGGWQLRAEIEHWLTHIATIFRGVSLGYYPVDHMPEFTTCSMKKAPIDALEKHKLDCIQKIFI
jgi:hypothetical protein